MGEVTCNFIDKLAKDYPFLYGIMQNSISRDKHGVQDIHNGNEYNERKGLVLSMLLIDVVIRGLIQENRTHLLVVLHHLPNLQQLFVHAVIKVWLEKLTLFFRILSIITVMILSNALSRNIIRFLQVSRSSRVKHTTTTH